MAKRMTKMNFATKKAYFPTNRVIKEHFCFPRMCTSQNFDFLLPNLFRSFSLALFFFFFFFFLLHLQVLLPGICMELWLANFKERDKFSFQKVVGKQQNWQWIFPQIVTFFVNVTLLGLVRKSKTRYRWKYLLTLSLTDLFSRSEFIISSRAWS